MADPRRAPDQRSSAPDLEILGDQVTLHPSGYIEPPQRDEDGDKERNLVEHMARFRSSPLEFLREVSLHVSGVSFSLSPSAFLQLRSTILTIMMADWLESI